jgi:polyisoprenoid-binding protein YceI/alkylhydroperoxidase family enzyme
MTTTAVQPFTGSFSADPDHSSFQAQLRHMGVGSFRTGFDDVEARLEVGGDEPRLTGRARSTRSPARVRRSFAPHVVEGAEFFDAPNYTEIAFESRRLQFSDDGAVALDGVLTMRGMERPITATGISTDIGFIPNMAGVAAGAPVLLRVFDGMRRAVGSGGLAPVACEVAGLAVGVAVDNHYGVAFHSTVVGNLGLADAEIECIRAGRAAADPKLAAIAELARSITLERGRAGGAVRCATAAGWSREEILEVVAECAFAGLVGAAGGLRAPTVAQW